jgi:hypothetical protein
MPVIELRWLSSVPAAIGNVLGEGGLVKAVGRCRRRGWVAGQCHR